MGLSESGIRMVGKAGEVRYSYQLAAKLGPWQLNGDTLVAQTTYRNDTWLDIGQLSLTLQLGRSVWAWEHAEVVVMDPLTLRVIGSPETSSAESTSSGDED